VNKPVVLLLLLFAVSAHATELALPNTAVHLLHARANDVDYKLYVSTPADYETGATSYPVLYLLDADYSFPVARAIVEHMSDRARLQKLIVVGIAYGGPPQYRLNRTRDYTPKFSPNGGYGAEMQKHSGGGPKFLAFLREELIPWVDAHYRTRRDDRGLVGHSYGGLFTSWVLLTAPDLFNRYIIVSPSLWYDERVMFALEKKSRDSRGTSGRATRVYLSVGAREGNAQHDMVRDLQQFSKLLRARKNLNAAVKLEIPEDEHHDSVFPTALSRGIRFTFEGD
jgi:predicted alpha/beta superfamily hydrolase